jgi:hypothetical protein
MRRTFRNRPATAFFFGLIFLASCRRRPPPPPAVVSLPAATVAPVPTVAPADSIVGAPFQYVQAIGVNDTSILLSLDLSSPLGPPTTPGAPTPPGLTPRTLYMVVSLADGCVVKTDQFPMLDEASSRTVSLDEISGIFGAIDSMLDGGDHIPAKKPKAPLVDAAVGPPRVLPIVNGPIFREQFARKQKLFADFDANGDGTSAWAADGSRAMFAADDQMYRSDDGVKFSVVDVNASYGPLMTRDGRLGLYRRCSHPCGGGYRLAQIALGHASHPQFVVGPDMHDYAFDPGEKSAVYAREVKGANQICIERLALDTGKIARVACEPTSLVISENVLSMADDESFGALQTYDGKPGTPHLVIFDLHAGTRERSIDVSANVPPIDGTGRIAVDDALDNVRIFEGTTPKTSIPGEALAWDHKQRIVILHRSALSDPSKCGLVSAVAP